VSHPDRRRLCGALVAAAVVAGGSVLGTPVTAAAAAPVDSAAVVTDAADDVPSDPLQVVIERLNPSTVPERGRVTVAGTVRNRSTVDWSQLKVYLLTSYDPLTSQADLADAAASGPLTEIGPRITDPDLYTAVPDLAPGESTSFRLSVPRDRLNISGEAGVYWLGVHVLGTAEGARIDGADGRARTFLPLVPPRTPATRLALAVQLRNHTVRAPDGSLGGLSGWQAALSRDGRLGRLVRLGATAGGFPLTWLVDPAVLDAARSVAHDNPPLTLDAAPPDEGGAPADDPGGDTGADSGNGTGSASESPEPDPAVDPDDTPVGPEARTAAGWLTTFTQAVGTGTVLALPYGDLDVDAAVRLGQPELAGKALAISGDLLTQLGLPWTGVLAPIDGLVSPTALPSVGSDVPVLVTREAVADAATPAVARSRPGSVLERFDGGRILVTPSTHAVWGPGPGARRTALSVRQRLLADAALHAMSPRADEPLVRMLPVAWDPGTGWRGARFFRGLDQPWLSGVNLADTVEGATPEGQLNPVLDLDYPETQADKELSYGPIATASRLTQRGTELERMLTDNTVVDDELARQALLTTSVWSRRRPVLATARARAALELVDGWLGSVTVRGPSFVTMSSETGTFLMTLVNGLDQPVTVGLRATVPDGVLDLTTSDPIELPPRGRGPVEVDATASGIGVHQVTLQPVSSDGDAVGQVATLSIRSSRVGMILWVVMGVGSALLFLMIAYRIVQRVRQRRRTHGPVLQRSDR
jgi:hypothetical protein